MDDRMALNASQRQSQTQALEGWNDGDNQTETSRHTNRWAGCTLMRQLKGGIASTPDVKAWLAIHDGEQTSHVVYRFERTPPDAEDGVLPLAAMQHAHVVPIETTGVDHAGRLLIRTPYTGNQQQWIRLADVLAAKGGQLSASEAERAVLHLLEASAEAHQQGLVHGEISLDRVLVDRHGRVMVELYGVDRVLDGLRGSSEELRRDELRSISVIAYTLITGIAPSEPPITASRLTRRPSRAWDSWLARGLDPSTGFDRALDAMAALPSVAPDEPTPTVRVVRSVLRSFGSRPARRQI
jgi:serine/threonine protein kinase